MVLASVVLNATIKIQVHHFSDGNTEVIVAEEFIIDKHHELVGLTKDCDNKFLSWSERHTTTSLFPAPTAI